MRLVEVASRSRWVADQDKDRTRRRHRAFGKLEDDVRHTARLVHNRHDVACVDTSKSFRRVSASSTEGDEVVVAARYAPDAILSHFDLDAQKLWQPRNPPLRLWDQTVLQLTTRRRSHRNLHVVAEQQVVDRQPSAQSRLPNAVARANRNPRLASIKSSHRLALPVFDFLDAQNLSDEEVPVYGTLRH